MKCRQQKCLVHLIGDLNDELWKNPFKKELERFVSAVRELLVPIFTDVRKYGLKRRHLHKHQRSVDRFYRDWVVNKKYQNEIVAKFQKRFIRYQDSLFVFLTENNIPWNNNVAERALRHLAVQRKISGTFFERLALQYLKILGIMQTCRFQDKSFLGFLLSGEKDIDKYRSPKLPKSSTKVPRKESL